MLKRISLSGLILVLLSGCAASITSQSRPDTYFNSALPVAQSTGSLVTGDADVLSDSAIHNILQHRYQAPPLSRIAVMPYGREIWSSWSEELSVATEQVRVNVMGRLRQSSMVYDAAFLPSILIPEQKTVPHLREAAARYQADLLLIYRSYCQSFERYRLFAADESRAFCGVEAVLLDTRTGLVPFTSVTSQAFDIKKRDADINFRETIMRAQLGAVSHALSTVSDEVVAFLEQSRLGET